MTREALNLTISEPLRRARVRERLDAIADPAGMTPPQIAGRALTLGLGLIESDMRLIFPGQSPTSTAIPCSAPPSAPPSSTATQHTTQPCAATDSKDAPRIAPTTSAEPDTAKPREALPKMVSTEEAARALGYRSTGALIMHCQRHPELTEHSEKQGRARLWRRADLKAAVTLAGYGPR